MIRGRSPILSGAAVLALAACGGSRPPAEQAKAAQGSEGPPIAAASPPPAAPVPAGSELTDDAPVAFRADLSQADLSGPWNIFGAAPGVREVHGGPDGLKVRVAGAQKAWDAVGARTNRVQVDGNFDLRGRFQDFGGPGNVSAKLIVVDAGSPRGEAAYVERLQTDGKNVFKFGGEVEGSLETWGIAPTQAKAGDLRLVREGEMLRAFAREGTHGPWTDIGPAQKAPRSMPRVVKFGVKLSAGAGQSAEVRWSEITMNGQLIRKE